MSKPRRIADAERTAEMLDLLRLKYAGGEAMAPAYVVEEVAPTTGWSSTTRYADMLVLSVWPSNGLTLDGYEVKASKADLKKELADPSKHQALARYCDAWWLLAWDESILVDGIPESWGIVVTVEGEHSRILKTIRKAAKREPEPWTRGFVCSMVRNASEQAPGAAYVARACVEAARKGRGDGASIERQKYANAVHDLARVLYGRDQWKWPREAHDIDSLLKIATEKLSQNVLGAESAA